MKQPTVFILDVDGVMTDGRMYYTDQGKVMKVFGPDDNDALKLINQHLAIQFVSADKRGFPITKARIVDDMQYPLHLVSSAERPQWIREHFDPNTVVYMGDGIFDHHVFKTVAYSIAPANADTTAKRTAHFVTERSGGDRAVAEASLHLLEKFFVGLPA